MISPVQCRAARALLSWTQEQLASAAEVGVVTVRQFEGEAATPRKATLSVIAGAFERAGVVFDLDLGAGPGVRFKDAPYTGGDGGRG